MNTCEVFETAIRDLIAEFCPDTIPSSWLRCAQNMCDDLVNPEGMTTESSVYIVASPKRWRDEGATWDLFFAVQIDSLSESDRHAYRRADLYEAVENLFDKLLADAGETEERKRFVELVRRERPTFTFGGFTPDGDTGGAVIVEGRYVMNFGGMIHFSL